MRVIGTAVQPESSESSNEPRDVEHVFPLATDGPPLETELSSIIGRLMTGALGEASAVVERFRAASQSELEVMKGALEEQTRRTVTLSESLLQKEGEVEELRAKLQVERENTKAATDACEKAQRTIAEMEYEQTIADQLTAAYELRLRDLRSELDAMRAAYLSAKQQCEIEAAEQERLIAALKTVQQACARVESRTHRHEGWTPAAERPEIVAPTPDQPAAPTDDETPVPTPSEAPQSLKLVTSTKAPPAAAPPQLVEYLQALFEQINAMYSVDLQAFPMADVVDRLSANVRYARHAFVQRASYEGANGGDLFDQHLAAKMDDFGATSLGRHLSIAAFELTHTAEANPHAEAS